MAGNKCTAVTRSSIEVYIAPTTAACTPPPFGFTVPVTVATAATRSVAVATITTTAFPAGFDLPSGSFLNIVNPTTGEETIVRTTSRVQAAATTLPVTNIPTALPVGAIVQFPMRLSGRTGFNMQRQGNAITIQTFDAVGEDQVKVVSRSTTVDAPGVQSPLSAAFQTILTSQVGAYFYVWAEEAPTSAIYSRGLRMEGVAALVSDSINYNPADVTRNDLSLQFTEGLTIIQPTLAP